MAMRLNRLESLHQDMNAQGIIKNRFVFNFRNLEFSVVYIAENFPHILLFGCIAHQLFLVLEVNDRYEIATYLGDNYRALVDALNLEYDPNNPFRPNVFFDEFSLAIPMTANANNTPTMTEVAVLSRDVEEADKIHFCGWRPHDGVNSNARSGNLHKTLRLCGAAAHKVCREYNISSRWTDDASKAVPYYPPNT
ncbi:DUF6037 family protein [Methylobacter marinus]|uniref:DUF6037 family protein n=1 Tax=Methylobacter marinus TaxID=34058 RepID=UPI00037AA2B9|nr:DUF6037 family protein [Methylobacter marinus]